MSSKTKTNTKTKTNYERCKQNIIGQDMRLFKQGKLKQRNKQPVKNRKQAIAIALSMAGKKCKSKRTRTDARRATIKMKKKLEKNSYKNPITLNDMRNIIQKLKYLKDKKRYTAYRTLKLKILSQIIMTPSISSDTLKFAQNYLRNEK
jgi:hypothetical protein